MEDLIGCPEGQTTVSGFKPNGLLPSEATSVSLVLDQDRWLLAEERSAELIAHIQPNKQSEEHRKAVASYVKHLIMKCFSCEVFTFGSVPLKTYLPDGDIDLTVICSNQNVKDSWAFKVRDILESEGKSEDAEFHVKEVQYIQAEVKIIKCLVENIVVDISFNQLGGLCTLCFLEEVDNRIKRNHLFKRSIILIKAWCYYESRLLGASHGLISTYALETLVLYIFNVYNNTFAGPLEVLYRFLEFFSKFDWDNYCLSLWGPVPISSLPNMNAEPPLKDCKELLLDKMVLNAFDIKYGVMPSSQENQKQPFVAKCLNIVDPLRVNNNLGRSISKGNFFRIRKAFTFGAQQLLRLLDCPEENFIAEFDLFFRNTWGRYWKGYWPDAPSYDLYVIKKNVIGYSTCHDPEDEHAQASNASHYTYQKHGNQLIETKPMFGTTCLSAVSRSQSPKTNSIFTSIMIKNALTGKDHSPKYLSNEVHIMHHFDGVHSHPEFAHVSGVVPSRHNGVPEMEKGQIHSRPNVLANHNDSVSVESQQQASYNWRNGDDADLINDSNSFNTEFGGDLIKGNGCSIGKAMNMHKQSQDLVDVMETYSNLSSSGYLEAPVNVNSSNVPFLVPSPVLSSGYTPSNSFAMLPVNVPSFESFWSQSMPCSKDLIPFPALHWFPSLGVTSNQEEHNEPIDDNIVLTHLDRDHSGGFLSKENMNSVGGYSYEDWNIQMQQPSDGKMVVTAVCSSSCNSSWLMNSENYLLIDCEPTIEQRLLTSKTCRDDLLDERSIDGYVNSTTRSRCIVASCSTSTSELSPSCFSNTSPSKASELNMDQRKLSSPSPPSAISARLHDGKHIDHTSAHPDHGSEEQICQSTIGTEKLNSNINDATSEYLVKQRSDILCGDFTSYWLNLQYGRFCQNLLLEGPLSYPPYVPPMYVQGKFPCYGPRSPSSVNIMAHGGPLVPVMPVECGSDSCMGINQLYADELPRYRGGTGTYLPNPESYKKYYPRMHSNNRNQRVNYNYDRKDHPCQRERNWNFHSKPRCASSDQFYYQVDWPGIRMDNSNLSNRQPDRPWN